MNGIGAARLFVGLLTLFVLGYTYISTSPVNGLNPFDYFGFFTNLTSLLTALLLIANGVLLLSGRSAPSWLTSLRAVTVTCMLIVGLIYNTLVPGTGTAPLWVSVYLHILLPAMVIVDWGLIGDRAPQPWSRLWWIFPYPLLWTVVVLIRGATDGWVPYGFLLPSRGAGTIVLHIVALFLALSAAGAVVWAVSRSGGAIKRRIAA